MADTKMYLLLKELIARTSTGGGLNMFDPVNYNNDAFAAGATPDPSIYGFYGTLSIYTPSVPGLTKPDASSLRVTMSAPHVPRIQVGNPFWVTASGEIYTDKAEETSLYIELSDSGAINGTERETGVETGVGFKELKVTSTPQKFILYGFSDYFYNNSTAFWFDIEGPTGTNVWVKNFKVELGKILYPKFTPAHTYLRKITDAEIDTLQEMLES